MDGIRMCGAPGRLGLAILIATLAAAPLAKAHGQAPSGVPGSRPSRLKTAPPPPATAPVTVPDSSEITESMVQTGRSVFHGQGQCFVCHGANLEGVVGPTLRAHAWKDAQNGELSAIYRVVTHGVANTMMVAHPGGISDEQAVDVAVYVWSVSHGKAKP